MEKDKTENQNEEYTFVRETIKEKPPRFARVAFKALRILIMGIIFGLGICLVLFIFGKDIGSLFGGNGDDDTDSLESGEIRPPVEIVTDRGGEDIDSEDSINSKLVDVEVVFYEKETNPKETETQAESVTTEMYREEEVTAGISDNKEVQTAATVGGGESTTEKPTSGESTGVELPEEQLPEAETADVAKKIEEKKYFTGVVIVKSTELYICIDYDKIKEGDDIFVSVDGAKHVSAEIYGTNTINGMALLCVPAGDMDEEAMRSITVAEIADIDAMDSGDKLIYAGNPYGKGRLFYTGTLAGVDTGHTNYDTFYRGVITDISGNGISDGFLFNENGRLVAMISDIEDEQTAGKNITGICMEDMNHVLNALLNKSSINHIGIRGETVTDDMRDLTGESIPDGMYVTEVARESSAYKSGIMIGDIITSAGGKEVSGLKDIQTELQKVQKDGSITIVLKRKIGMGYNEFTIKVPVENY